MVPQPPAMVPQNLPAQPVALERAGSLNTQRSHSSQREWAAAAAVPASRKAATTSRRPATQASKKGGRRDAALPRAAVPAKQHAQQAQQQTQQQAQQQAQLHQQLERVLSAKASLPPAAQVAAAPAAVELPVALSPIVFSGFPSAGGLPAALQQEQPRQLRPLVHWASHDPSAQRPVKRAATAAPMRSQLDVASLKLSPAAALVAAQPGMPSAATDAGLLRLLFGSALPASWQP
ncbi:hypothetical protein C2E20_5069 [Micractinium conductrix]|uniref:Uncharacterized protein n=1 Tax=Micractinium conductrix TaxID=554055 RepID=A0A2P6VBM8_9CHLO|nr:hypothetical protein C2E20_5069 [Micractinium conductrix]|eukprot:PSC71486.1 hypothetical protein C2E20_5069 [Micractinium conductrix]